MRNKCVALKRKAIKSSFQRAAENGIMSNRKFWSLINPYVSNKSNNTQEDIILLDRQNIVLDTQELTENFNKHYINIVESSCGRKPRDCSRDFPHDDLDKLVQHIMEAYRDHPSIIAIKNQDNLVDNQTFEFREVSVGEVNKLLHSLYEHISTGEDQLSPKLIKLAASVLDVPIAKAINASIF